MMYHTRGKDLQTSLLVAQIILAGNYHFTRMTELEWNAHSEGRSWVMLQGKA